MSKTKKRPKSSAPGKSTGRSKKSKTKVFYPADYGEVLDETLYTKPAYPWDIWADGKTRRLTHGKHFLCSTSSFVSAASQCARRLRAMGRSVSVGCRISGEFVTLQFIYKDGNPPPKTTTTKSLSKPLSKPSFKSSSETEPDGLSK